MMTMVVVMIIMMKDKERSRFDDCCCYEGGEGGVVYPRQKSTPQSRIDLISLSNIIKSIERY